MKVTDVNYSIEKLKVEKLNLMCARVSGSKKLQNVIGCDGQEGFGKSTITAGDSYYMSYKLKRPLLLFFDIDKLINHALTHEDHIYIWDDAAFAALSMEGYNKIILKLIKTVLLARKKRHTYFINIQEIFRLKEPLVSRMVGLTHVYSPDEISIGRYAYFRKDNLIKLYDKWQKSKTKSYKNYYTFKGTFPNIMYKIFDEEEYESLKDAAILTIADEKEDKKEEKMNELKHKVGLLVDKFNLNKESMAEHFNIDVRTIYRWINNNKDPDAPILTHDTGHHINNKGYIEPRTMYYQKMVKNKGKINNDAPNIIQPQPIPALLYNRPQISIP